MTLQAFTNALVTVTLIEMMLALGLGVTLEEVTAVLRNRRLVIQALVANYVCVPAVTVVLLLLFHASPMVAAGFLVLAVCPGAPFAPACAAMARGNVAVAVGVMVILAGSSALLAPPLLHVLLPLMSGNRPMAVDSAGMVTTLLATQLAPLLIGLGVRRKWSAAAQRLKKPADKLSALLSLATFGLIVFAQFPALAAIQPKGFLGMGILLVASLTAGWMLGGTDASNRRALSLTTALRNVGVGLVIGMRTFAGTPAVIAIAAYGIIEIIAAVALACWWRTRFPERILTGQKRS